MALAETRRLLEAGVAGGREPGVQLCVSLGREVVGEVCAGEAREGVPATAETLVFWISAIKPVMGVAFGLLVERGLVGWDDRVAEHLPAFAAGGKGDVTLRHVLTHTGGFSHAWTRWHPSPPFDRVVAEICAAPQEEGWVPGVTSGYNVAAGWYVLGAVLEAVDGRAYAAFVRDEIFGPLGMDDCWVSMPEDRYAAYGGRVAVTPFLEDGAWKTGPAWSTAEGAAILRPGGNGYGPARQLVRLYEMLLGGGERDGARVLAPATMEALLERHRPAAEDRIFGIRIDRGLGLVLNSRVGDPRFGWFGSAASADAFGHAGYFSTVAFADPAHDLVVALAFIGVREDPQHFVRMAEALDAIYADLGLPPDATPA